MRQLMIVVVSWCWLCSVVYGVGQKLAGGAWTYELDELQSSLNIPVSSESSQLVVPVGSIRHRARYFSTDPRIEPITLTLKAPYADSAQKVAKEFAISPHMVDALAVYLKEQPHGLYPLSRKIRKTNPQLKRVIIGTDSLALININRLQSKLGSPSHRLTIRAHELADSEKVQFYHQVKPFLSHAQLTQLKARLTGEHHRGEKLSEKYFLPEFPRKMLRRHVHYRGPNCFHAAMAFQDQALITMSRTNLRREPNHHRLMINHDELWHILNWYFYEIDPARSSLKYGDVIVFLDVPAGHNLNKPAKYSWIIHAGAYLFNEFVFSKGSKSPNTAYTIKTLAEEWNVWSRHAERLVVKVFRKNYVNLAKKSMILSRNDWLQ